MLSTADFVPKIPEMISLLKRLVETESPSTDKAGVDALGAIVAAELRQRGAQVTIEENAHAGNNVIGRWGTGADGIVLMCHMDTVHERGTLARFPFREAEGKLHGPGVYDMKASIVQVLTVVQTLREKQLLPNRPITALFTCDEEIGSRASRRLIEETARHAALVLCLEPGLANGALKTSRKGIGDFEIIARGVAAHSGTDHEKGRNAIAELAHHILAAQALTDYAQGTTINVGVISGGTRANVVPNEARVLGDVRILSATEEQRIMQWLAQLKPVTPGTQVETRGKINRPPMPRDATMIAAFEKAKGIAAGLGIDLSEGATGGGSDANFVAPLGVSVLDGLGPLGGGAHSEREHVLIASLPERAALLAALVAQW